MRGCNGGKTSAQPDEKKVEAVATDALRWSLAIRQAAAERAENLDLLEDTVAAFNEQWKRWFYEVPKTVYEKQEIPRDATWTNTIERFVELGLEQETLLHLANVALTRSSEGRPGPRDTWRYFCGCAWKELERRQARAAELIASGQVGPQTQAEHRRLENERITRELLDQLP